MRSVVRVVLSLLPLGLTPALGYVLANGHLNLGGGEKDILVLLPWLVWSLLFAVSSWVFWRREYSITRSLLASALVGLFGLAIVGVALTILGQLGIGGLL